MNLRLWAVFLEMRDLDILLRQVQRDNTLELYFGLLAQMLL